MEDELKLFLTTDWSELMPALVRHAEKVTLKYQWRTPKGTLPRGKEAADIVSDAIMKTFEWIKTGNEGSGSRRWNRIKNPELADHLRSAIESEIYNLVKTTEHKKTNYSPNVPQEEADEKMQASIDNTISTNHDIANDNSIDDDDVFKKIFEELRKKMAADNTALTILQAFAELAQNDSVQNIKPADIAKRTSIPIDDVRNAIKRIRRTGEQIKRASEKDGETYE